MTDSRERLAPGPPARERGPRMVDYGMMGLVLLILGYAAYASFLPDPKEKLEGASAPAFNLKTVSGNVEGFDPTADQVVVLDFWATWCKPCERQMPYLAEIERDATLAGKVTILSINTDQPSPDRVTKVRNYIERGSWPWDPLLDNGPVMGLYEVDSFPTLVVIDRSGKVHHIESGVHDADTLRRLIAEAGAS